MGDDWKKPYEDDGVTLGPEDALHREIEKSKTLKVEKLQLKDAIEKLKAENDALLKTNQFLEQKLNSFNNQSAKGGNSDPDRYSPIFQAAQTPSMRWPISLLIFNLAAAGILLIFLLKQ